MWIGKKRNSVLTSYTQKNIANKSIYPIHMTINTYPLFSAKFLVRIIIFILIINYGDT